MSGQPKKDDGQPLTVRKILQQGIACHQAGRWAEAERLYRAVLQVQPQHPDANHNLGLLALAFGKPAAALPHLQAALDAQAPLVQYWLSYVTALVAVGDIASAHRAIEQAERQGMPPEHLQELKRPLAGTPAEPAKEPSREEKKQLAVLFNAGRHIELEELARTLTSRFPADGYTWSMLGAVLGTTGRPSDAVGPLEQAARLMPNLPEVHSNLGAVLREVGRAAEAEGSCRRAIELKPDFSAAHSNLANVLRDLGRLHEAEASCLRAIDLKPDYAEALCILGNVQKDLGRLEEAVTSLRRALALRPNYAEAYAGLGLTFLALGRPGEAEPNFHRAIELKPAVPETHNNFGNTLQRLGKLREAEASYRRAIELDPRSAEAHSNLGTSLVMAGRTSEAEGAFRRALELKPDLAEVHSNLGNVLHEAGSLSAAEAALRRAIELNPDLPEAYSNLGNVLKNLGCLTEAGDCYQKALQINPEHAKARSNRLLYQNYLSEASPAAIHVEHRNWGQAQPTRSIETNFRLRDRRPDRRLRIGYVSPDLKQHSVAYFLEPLLKEHDHSVVEVFCYADVPRPDATTVRLRGFADHWRDTLGLPDENLAQRIADDRIDILVDLAGHTAGNRLLAFARKPAPVQVSWLGYPNTTGLPAMDYRLVDDVTDPSGADDLATERLLRLSGGFLCYAAPTLAPDPERRGGTSDGNITFGSFNNPAKLSSATLKAWSLLLDRVPGSQLLLKGSGLDEPDGQSHLAARLHSHGIDPRRVNWCGRTPRVEAHLSQYSRMDVALDPFPYNGTTTTCEALWMGVPVVTLCGDRHAARVGASLLTQVALSELIARSVESYVDVAATLAGDVARLNAYRLTLRKRMAQSRLCDARAFARKIEAAYREMWQSYCAGLAGAS